MNWQSWDPKTFFQTRKKSRKNDRIDFTNLAFETEWENTFFLFSLRIIGPSYRGVWPSIAGFWDLQTTSFEIPWFLGLFIFVANLISKLVLSFFALRGDARISIPTCSFIINESRLLNLQTHGVINTQKQQTAQTKPHLKNYPGWIYRHWRWWWCILPTTTGYILEGR